MPYLRTADAARRTGFHRGTLTRFALDGQVRAVRTPEGWLFDADSLAARTRLAPGKWTDEEIQTMAEMLPRFNLETIARKLGRSPKAVFHKMTRSGQHRYGQGWLTTGDVAEMTGWSTQTINGWCRSGRIKAHKCPAGLTRRTGPAWWMIAPKEAGRVPRRSADRGRARRAPKGGRTRRLARVCQAPIGEGARDD